MTKKRLTQYLLDDALIPIDELYADPNNLDLQSLKRRRKPRKESDMKTIKNFLILNTKCGKKIGNNIMIQTNSSRISYLPDGFLVDPIFVWKHPEVDNKYVVCEGNTRLWAPRFIE